MKENRKEVGRFENKTLVKNKKEMKAEERKKSK